MFWGVRKGGLCQTRSLTHKLGGLGTESSSLSVLSTTPLLLCSCESWEPRGKGNCSLETSGPFLSKGDPHPFLHTVMHPRKSSEAYLAYLNFKIDLSALK